MKKQIERRLNMNKKMNRKLIAFGKPEDLTRMIEILGKGEYWEKLSTITYLRECFYGSEQLPVDFKDFIKF